MPPVRGFGWAENGRNGRSELAGNPPSGTAVFGPLFKTHLRNRLLPPPRCREIVKEMTRVMLRQHSHPRRPQAFLAQRCLWGRISPASAQCSLQLPSQKERKASHSGPSAKKIVGSFFVFGTSFKIL